MPRFKHYVAVYPFRIGYFFPYPWGLGTETAMALRNGSADADYGNGY